MSTTAGENVDLNLSLATPLHLRSSSSPSAIAVTASSPYRSHPRFLSNLCSESLSVVPGNPRPSATFGFAPKNEIEKSEEYNCGYGVSQRSPASNYSPLEQAPSAHTKQPSKRKSSRDTIEATKGINADLHDNLNLGVTYRYDNSLGLLTKKFIGLLQEADDGTLDLNHSAEVLEGEIGYLSAEDRRLDCCIREKLEQIRTLESDVNCQKRLFLTEEDIRRLPHFRDKTLIAIKAPYASSIEVPDPCEDVDLERQYKLILRSTTGPIDLFLLSKQGRQHEDITVKHEKPLDAVSAAKKMDDACPSPVHPCSLDSTASKLSGVHKIVPSHNSIDDDYWLRSEEEVSATALWGIE
uniref:E2F4,5 n=1 Tax=Solanum tuberosum TaxID=4113 RepID=M0ZWR9_SOLTU